jgi:hypothetical protein
MWRYVGEMEEIAQAFKVAGLPSGFHTARPDSPSGSFVSKT